MSVMVDPVFEAEAAYRAERVRADFRPSRGRSTGRRTGALSGVLRLRRGVLRLRRGVVRRTACSQPGVCPGHATLA